MAEAPGMHNPNVLPPDIPAPQDDGAARHLTGMRLPDIALPATDGAPVESVEAQRPHRPLHLSAHRRARRQALPPAGTASPARAAARRSPAASATTPPNSSGLASRSSTACRRRTPPISRRRRAACICRLRCCRTRRLRSPRRMRLPTFDGRRHEADQAHGLGDRRRRHHPSVLSGVPARTRTRRRWRHG